MTVKSRTFLSRIHGTKVMGKVVSSKCIPEQPAAQWRSTFNILSVRRQRNAHNVFDGRLLVLPCSRNIKLHTEKVALSAAPLKNLKTALNWKAKKENKLLCLPNRSEKPLLVTNLLTHRNHADDQGYSFLLVNASILNTALGIQLKHQQRIQREWRFFGCCFFVHHQVTSEKMFPSFISVSHQILHLSEEASGAINATRRKISWYAERKLSRQSFLFIYLFFF